MALKGFCGPRSGHFCDEGVDPDFGPFSVRRVPAPEQWAPTGHPPKEGQVRPNPEPRPKRLVALELAARAWHYSTYYRAVSIEGLLGSPDSEERPA